MSTTILIVDDDLKIRTIYRNLLIDEGYQVQEAANGEEATLSILRDKSIGIILLDINMPMIDGPTFFDLARYALPKTKVIVTSVSHIDEQKTLIDHADDYHDKLNGTAELLSKVRKVTEVVR